MYTIVLSLPGGAFSKMDTHGEWKRLKTFHSDEILLFAQEVKPTNAWFDALLWGKVFRVWGMYSTVRPDAYFDLLPDV